MTTLNRPVDIPEYDYINAWYVIDEDAGKRWHYKTENGAIHRFEMLRNAALVQETNMVNRDITLARKHNGKQFLKKRIKLEAVNPPAT